MPKTPQEYSQQIRAQLKVLDPAISADPLTPERKIIDTVAEVIAEAQVDQYVQNYMFDIDTKFGTDLDKFIALFGFARQAGRRATGNVTFSRATIAPQDILIPSGTQLVKPATLVSSPVLFYTTASVVLAAGTTEVEAPIEASDVGVLSNVPANTIISMGANAVAGISEVTNENSTSGGTAEESDAELRVRFKNTIFRNVSGTNDQFLALAIGSSRANKAIVIGPQSRFFEYLQVEPDLVIQSQIPYSKYTYPFDYYLTNGDAGNEIFFNPAGVDYSFNATASHPNIVGAKAPTLTVANALNLPVGSVVLLEHTYCSINSRNDPQNDITNYIDIYVSGQDPENAIEAVQFPTSATAFVNNPVSAYHYNNFKRSGTNITPTVGNRFSPLVWQPIYSLPETITIDGTTYYEGTHYWLVKDNSNYRGSRRSRDGIEWVSGITNYVVDSTEFLVNYIFDKLPMTLNELMDAHKQVTTDVLVHSAVERFINVNVIIMYTPGFSREAVDEAAAIALSTFLSRMQFGTVVQISDLLDVIHDVPGVDNVRLATPSDGVAYGVQEVAEDGSPIGYPYTTDFYLSDAELPVLNAIVSNQRSQNTW